MSSKIVAVGGTEYVVGGWGEYEIRKEQIRRVNGGKSSYCEPERGFITETDVIEKATSGQLTRVIKKVLERVRESVKNYEEKLMKLSSDTLVIPDVTSAEIVGASEALDTEELRSILERLSYSFEQDPKNVAPPPKPEKNVVKATDIDKLSLLEENVISFLYELEEFYALLSEGFERVKAKIDEISGDE